MTLARLRRVRRLAIYPSLADRARAVSTALQRRLKPVKP
jgi:hypothetical protein